MKLKLKARVNSSDDQTTRQALDQLAAKSSATKEGDEFIVRDLRKRTAGRYQVTSDQYNGYVGAMREHFGQNVDFGQLHKIYGRINTDGWYGGGQVIGAVPHVKIGRPDWSRISTSHIERANLSVRMHLRRLTRLTNAFSKKLSNLAAAVTLYVAFYNFCRVHQTLKVTPAMAAGLTDHVWTIEELLR